MTATLEANLRPIGQKDRSLADRIREAKNAHPQRLSFTDARTGDSVPILTFDEKVRSLHSRYDPRREAARLYDPRSYNGYLVALGLGGAYHLRPLLENDSISRLLIVEPDLSMLRSILSTISLEPLFQDSRVALFCGRSASTQTNPGPLPEELWALIRSEYSPFVDERLSVLTLPARSEYSPELFKQLAQAAHAAEQAQLRDYRAHSIYGRQWFRNSLLNLRALPHTRPVTGLPAAPKAIVVAAGPSVELHAEAIRRQSRDATLICCDTALGTLKNLAIEPDIAVTIDCQVATLLHFICDRCRAPLAASLSAPPSLLRSVQSPTLFASQHPLEQLISGHLSLPSLDVSGGNVTHSACSLAEALGAKEIHLYGADYSYPYGRPYARGSYFYDYLDRRHHRLSPYEDGLYRFLYRRGELSRVERGEYWAYKSALLERYRNELRTATTIPIRRVAPDGREEWVGPDRHPEPEQASEATERHHRSRPDNGSIASGTPTDAAFLGTAVHLSGSAHGAESTPLLNAESVAEVFAELERRITQLEVTDQPLWSQINGMPPSDRSTLFALVPLATHLEHDPTVQTPDRPAALKAACEYARRLFKVL